MALDVVAMAWTLVGAFGLGSLVTLVWTDHH